MTHPEELLAGFVDGTLSAKERVTVEAHVAACARCGGEVSLAAASRSALRSLPEMQVPAGIAARALEEAGASRRSAGDDRTPRWYRIGGMVAAAAAGLLVLTLVLPHIGQGDDAGAGAARDKAATSARDTGAATALAAVAIEIRHVNYDDTSLTELTSTYRSDAAGGAAGAEASPARVFGSQKQTDAAIACIAASAPKEGGDLQSLIRARFTGTPAYLAVFLDGPGAGQPADAVTVWAFAVDDCRILSFSSAQL